MSSASVCNWAGIECNSNGLVTALKLPGIGINGEFPFFLNRLTALEELDLSFGALSGTIPAEIASLPNLRILDLSHNLLTEPIPVELSTLPLETLRLNVNQFRGTIPAIFGSFSNIIELDLSGNEFSGPLPEELGQAATLQILALGDNSLAGASLPASFASLTALRELSAPRCGLVGSIPVEFVGLTNMEKLDLQSNSLVNSLPSMPWPQLISFEVQSNELSGGFPQNFQ